MRKSAIGAILAAAAVVAATSACSAGTTGNVAGAGAGNGTQPVGGAAAADAIDLSAPGGSDAAMAAPPVDAAPGSFGFRTIDDPNDPTFNQLLGIDDRGDIVGYFGSGAAGHPNQGYVIKANNGRMSRKGAPVFTSENYAAGGTRAVQTQVTGIEPMGGATVGFFSTMNNADMTNDNTGFFAHGGSFRPVSDPHATSNATPPVNQLLGINDDGLAAGFYNDSAGNAHGYAYDTEHRTFTPVTVSGATSATATAINDRDQVAGFDTAADGTVEGFLGLGHGKVTHLRYPGSSMTQALGLNNRGEVVGLYQTGTGSSAQTHGFTWTAKHGFKAVDDPSGSGGTTVNGVNDAGDLVGFYVDGAGNTHGMLAWPGGGTTGGGPTSTPSSVPTSGTTPSMGSSSPSGSMPSMSMGSPTPTGSPSSGSTATTYKLSLSGMPSGTVSVTRQSDGRYQAHVSAFGFTPGSSHLVQIEASDRSGPVLRFGAVQADATGTVDQTIDSVDTTDALPSGSRFVVYLGDPTNDFNRSAIAEERIAAAPLPGRPDGSPATFQALEFSPDNQANLGTLRGSVTITYDPAAQTVTATLNASGLSAGNHAAHLHQGSCQAQGAPKVMFPDFTADAHGDVVGQTRTVSGVTSLPSQWYFNLHQGDMNSILSNGSPAPSFRPLLCANGTQH